MHQEQKDYEHLHKLSRETRLLEGISSLLDWDHETYMPIGAMEVRAEQLKLLAGIIHKRKTGKAFSAALAKLIDIKKGTLKGKHLNGAQKTAVKEWRRDYIKEKVLPKRFIEDFTQLTTQSIDVWRQAKEKNAYKQFMPFLEKIVWMSRKKAELLGYQEHPYDALLDCYEPDITTREVTIIFSNLRKTITTLLKKITKIHQKIDNRFLFGEFPQDQQLLFSQVLLNAMHFDLSKGRLDISTHPFSSSSHPTDNRITTRIHPTSLMSNISAVMHETGHALYEMGLPIEHYGSPLGQSISFGIHESQSRFWETFIGLSKPFWQCFLPELKKHFKGKLDKVTLEQFYKGINKVSPSLIRIEADEVSYSLHVILRFELEKALIEGSLSVRDLPEAWNEQMNDLLGLIPTSDSEGCLQDIHWSMGSFGYFPAYTLGNLYASHLFQGFSKHHPNWEQRMAKGDLQFIKYWLQQNVYQYGRQYTSKELLFRATGKEFSADAYCQYLQKKFT